MIDNRKECRMNRLFAYRDTQLTGFVDGKYYSTMLGNVAPFTLEDDSYKVLFCFLFSMAKVPLVA